jgi:predicted signal transduction protein with EAL and GGDEF domain
VRVDDTPLSTSVSIGVATSGRSLVLSALMEAADAALYRAKRGGRNRVEIATELDGAVSLDQVRKAAAAKQGARAPTVVHQFDGTA